jgi:hypothetical protein
MAPSTLKKIAFVVLFLLWAVVFLGNQAGFEPYRPFYVIEPQHCNTTLFAHSDWYRIGKWNLLICDPSGVCPELAITKADQGSFPYQHACMSFSTSLYHWSVIDDANKMAGYPTKLYDHSRNWRHASNLMFAANCLQFFFAIFTVGIGLIIQLYVMPICFIMWVIAMALIEGTDQLNSAAWSTSFFNSCTVTVAPALGYYTSIGATYCAGMFCVCAFTVHYSGLGLTLDLEDDSDLVGYQPGEPMDGRVLMAQRRMLEGRATGTDRLRGRRPVQRPVQRPVPRPVQRAVPVLQVDVPGLGEEDDETIYGDDDDDALLAAPLRVVFLDRNTIAC